MKKTPAQQAEERRTVHVALDPALKKKLKTMCDADRRKHSDFIRLLIDQEWDRRQKGAQP
jgi:mRNA-degrading endonuclease RelE of RelBE toxin-antitoxin system